MQPFSATDNRFNVFRTSLNRYAIKLVSAFSLLMMLATHSLYGQNNCATQPIGSGAMLNDQVIEDIHRWQAENESALNSRAVINIPTVVHIVWHNPTQNLTDSMVQAVLALVNMDWRRQNADTVNTPDIFLPDAADMEIQFILANVAPDGSPTNGITHTYTDSTSFLYELEHMKYDSTGGASAWDDDQYLNIWVVPAIEFSQNTFGTLLAVSSYPGSSDAVRGTCIRTDRFDLSDSPPYSWRHLTHELAHFFCIMHISGIDSCYNADLIEDTPISRMDLGSIGSTNCDSINTCGSTTGDMIVNHIEYFNNGCTNMFTHGQAAWALACLNTNYPLFLNSPGLSVSEQTRNSVAVFPNPAEGTINVKCGINGHTVIVDCLGRVVLELDVHAGETQVDISGLADGMYLLRLHNSVNRILKSSN